MSLVDTREIATAKIVMLGGTGGSNVEGNPTGSAAEYLSKLQIDDTIFETAGVIPFDVTLINNSDIHISAVNAGQLDGKTILINTTTHTGTTPAGWFLKINQSTSYEMITPEGRSFKDAMSDNMAMIVRLDASQAEATVLGVLGADSSDVVSGLGIGKKTSVSNNVIITDIDLHRAPMAGDRLLIWFDASVQNPTGLTTYNNGTAVTSNLENVSPLNYNAGWNIVQFMNDGLLYNNVWVRKQNVPLPISTLSGLSDTAIASPSDGQLLTFDNDSQKWKNKTYVEANTGFPVTELKKLKVGNIVYDTDGMKNYFVSNVANNNITVSVLNSNQFVQEVIAINTGNHTGSSSAWNLVISDGLNPVSVALKNADGSPFADDIHENELLFVYVDTAGNIARVLGTAGASNEVYSAFNLLSKSEVAESVPYLYRRSGGVVRDVALEHLKKVVGASVAWNQLVQNGNFADGTTGWGATNGTISASNNVLTFTLTSGTDGYVSRSDVFNYRENHVIMCCATVKPPRNMDCGFYAGGVVDIKTVVPANTKRTVYGIVKASSNIQYPVMYVYMGRGGNNPLSVGDVVTIENVNAIDLTAMFGTAIADYIYSLEQATSGSGIAKLKEWGFFTKDYYAYNTGALQSVKTSGKKVVGKNLIPMSVAEIKAVNTAGTWSDNSYTLYGVTFQIITDGDTVIGFKTSGTATGYTYLYMPFQTLLHGNYVVSGCPSGGSNNSYNVRLGKTVNDTIVGTDIGTGLSFVADGDIYRVRMAINNGTVAPSGIWKLQLEIGTTATAFEPYTEKTYSLSDVELRGLFKLDSNNNLYADGDEYTPDGNIKRKYGVYTFTGEEVFEANGSNCYNVVINIPRKQDPSYWANAANMICEGLVTASQRDIYNGAITNAIGFTDSTSNTRITISNDVYNDRATKLVGKTMIYELATATTETTTPYNETMLVDGDGTEEFLDSRDIPVPVGHESGYNQAIKGLPTAPTADGNYKLRCTVTNGVPSFSWVSDT